METDEPKGLIRRFPMSRDDWYFFVAAMQAAAAGSRITAGRYFDQAHNRCCPAEVFLEFMEPNPELRDPTNLGKKICNNWAAFDPSRGGFVHRFDQATWRARCLEGKKDEELQEFYLELALKIGAEHFAPDELL